MRIRVDLQWRLELRNIIKTKLIMSFAFEDFPALASVASYSSISIPRIREWSVKLDKTSKD